MRVEYLTIGSRELVLERRQLADAGRPVEEVADVFDELIADMEADGPEAHQDAARALLDEGRELPNAPNGEPSDLDAIRAARRNGPRTLTIDDRGDPSDRLAGAWAGRLAGCLLGKPVETWTRTEIRRFLDTTDQSLEGYLQANVRGSDGFAIDNTGGWIDRIDGFRDDDIDFSVAALETLRREGPDVASEDIARTWLSQLPAGKLHTAERVAYRNILAGVAPPDSATHRNPYRELIGAQIRGDCYGYVMPGKPERAAALAYRDARMSHVRNGIYGAMWVAATLAAVPAIDTLRRALEVGLTEVPADSRFVAAVETVLSWHDDGLTFEEAIDRIHAEWDDGDYYEGYHVLPNAQIVTAVLTWAGSDFGTALAHAVGAGFDTDCNGATVGSIIGLHVGRATLPDPWIEPLDGRARTALADRPCPSLDWLTTETSALANQFV